MISATLLLWTSDPVRTNRWEIQQTGIRESDAIGKGFTSKCEFWFSSEGWFFEIQSSTWL